jgi:hypothetical protein
MKWLSLLSCLSLERDPSKHFAPPPFAETGYFAETGLCAETGFFQFSAEISLGED